MLDGNKIVVVFPAYNAEQTLRQTHDEIPHEYVDDEILVDDSSSDKTVEIARELGILTIVHSSNLGYGANQKTCYREACRLGADVVVMVHPDYQYSPRLVLALASMVTSGHYDAALGSRILGTGAIRGGMPLYKYLSNRFLTLTQNLLMGTKLSEYHTGFRAFSRRVLETLPLEENSNDFVFDNQMLAQIVSFGYRIGELSCPTRYMEEASSISFSRSLKYGFGVLLVSLQFFLARLGILKPRIFKRTGRKLDLEGGS